MRQPSLRKRSAPSLTYSQQNQIQKPDDARTAGARTLRDTSIFSQEMLARMPGAADEKKVSGEMKALANRRRRLA